MTNSLYIFKTNANPNYAKIILNNYNQTNLKIEIEKVKLLHFLDVSIRQEKYDTPSI